MKSVVVGSTYLSNFNMLCHNRMNYTKLVILLSSSISSSSSSSSPLCRVSTHIFLRQTMSLRNTLLQLFCRCCLWCLYLWFLHKLFCVFMLALSEVCVQCPIWLFSAFPLRHGFLVCCSRIFGLIWNGPSRSNYYYYYYYYLISSSSLSS